MSNLFGINIDENCLTASSDSDSTEQSLKNKSENFEVNSQKRSEQNLRLKSLILKRKSIKEKYERKVAKKLEKKNTKKKTVSSEIIEDQISRPCTSNLNFNEDLLNNKIEKALSQNDINLAETLSDQLAVEQHQAKINKNIEEKKLQAEIDRNKQYKKNKKFIPWRFEPKKRWETKSNM